MTKRELLVVEKAVFDQRTELKATKRKLGIKGDDDDLINQIKVGLQPLACLGWIDPADVLAASQKGIHRPTSCSKVWASTAAVATSRRARGRFRLGLVARYLGRQKR